MAWFRRHRIWTVVLLVVFLGIVLVGWSAVTVWRAAHHDGAADTDRADAIVVLGAAQYNGVPSPVFQGRLDHAVLLWQQGRADLVITVGSKQPGDRHTEAESGAAYLEQHGVPTANIVSLPIGHTTYQSLQAATHEMAQRGLDSAFLVSDPWHNARLDAMGSDLGIQAYPSATWTSADTSVITRGKEYIRETFAYLYYRILGGG
jgi:uncharacterized SAM-binding protein YcdF (DUF218 family)